SPIVDEQWNNAMQKYDLDGNLGEGIEHHHHDKGRNAYPRPKSKHTSKAWNKVLHDLHHRFGKTYQQKGQIAKLARQRGTLKRGVGNVMAVLDFIPILLDSPHSPVYMFGPTKTLNKAFYDENIGLYYEFKKFEETESYEDVHIQYFKDYNKIDGEWRGVLKDGEVEIYRKSKNTGDIYKLETI
ncbi:hypothetical protein, partial [Seonamhaeicola marinus]|uniref:hypothetical protein n=1 Tax=Seonamhaeicola marinus TaxID=1912246 RepID=UPI001652212D